MGKIGILDWIAMALTATGSLNWGLFAFGFNLVDAVLGVGSIYGNAVYVLVALSGIYLIYKAVAKK